ncbi:IS110 family transposase [Olsenella uli]|uniref:IS110 family transposase n=1 Tax=Olsenella uli TaxID=133926 RepID=UPI0012AB7363|nr:IS110 family transposase [Olsenella uli]
MSDYATQVGMDVHARSVSCRAMGLATGETWSKTVSGEGMEAELAPWLAKLPQPLRCAYESGRTGFALARFLREAGFACDVVAVSTLLRSPEDRRHKNDPHDAGVLLREMCNPASDMSLVWVPPTEVEGARDLARPARPSRGARCRCSSCVLSTESEQNSYRDLSSSRTDPSMGFWSA